MAKVIILGDAHAGASKSSDIIHDHMAKFYAFFFAYCNKNNIAMLIQEGDLYDDRKLVYINTIYRFREYFYEPLRKTGIPCVVLAGNHDVVYKNTNRINSISLLTPSNVDVVDMVPETVMVDGVGIDLYPWVNSENMTATMEFCKSSKSKFAVGHFEFSGFPMHPGTMAESGMRHELFSRYEQVFSGHYHTISHRDNIQYTGTPYELNWSDWNDPKGFWVLDTDTGDKEFIQNPYSLFEKISYIEGMSYDFTQVQEKYVKIVIVDKKSQKKFDSFVDNVNLNRPHDVKIIEASINDAVSAAVGVTDLVSTNQMITSVIDNMELEVDKIKLKNSVLELYAEAMVINNSF